MFFSYYFIRNQFLELVYQNGRTKTIALDQDFGRIIWRSKDWLGNRHTGILVGKDVHTGDEQVIHTHMDSGRPEIISMADFSKGKAVHFQKSGCNNQSIEVIRIGLEKILEGKPYSLFSNNCQMLTNQACNNVKKSPDVERGFMMFFGLLAGGLFWAAATER